MEPSRPSRFHSARVSFLEVLFLAILISSCGQGSLPPTPTPPPPMPETAFGKDHQPNIIIILTDDQRYDTMDFMPQTKTLIFDRGITFSKAYVTTPLCCPSRASILTGMYAHSTNVLSNTDELQRETFVDRLHQAGYYTGFIGKYLNSWSGSPRPEFDFWVGSPHQDYFDPRLNVNGEWQVVKGYETAIFGEYALQFIDQAAKQSRPWLLYYAVHAPHSPALPDPKYKDLYSDLPRFRPPSFDEEDISDKPFAGELSPIKQYKLDYNDFFRLQQLRTLMSVDDTVGAIVSVLGDHEMLDNTAVFYLSDNGMLFGEHRIAVSKVFPYEPSIHVPFGFYFPRLTTTPHVIDKLVANIDIAPTIYDLAGVPQPPEVEGMSLIPLIRGQETWRDFLMIESWGLQDTSPGEGQINLGTGSSLIKPYVAIRTERYIFIDNIGQEAEIYDLEKDPDQMQNEINNPDYAQIVKDLRAKNDFYRGPFMTELAELLATTPTPPAQSTP